MKLLLQFVCLVGLQSAFGGVACTCDQDKFAALEEQLTVLNKRLQLQDEHLQLQDEKIEALEKTAMPRHEFEENQIAFFVASHNNFGPVTVDTNIPFPVEYTNVGDAWDPFENAFQATNTGVYVFTASFRGDLMGNTAASIVHTTESGSQRVASLYSHSTSYTGDANVAIIRVNTGDHVSVQLQGDSGVIFSSSNNIFSTFTGYFLFQ